MTQPIKNPLFAKPDRRYRLIWMSPELLLNFAFNPLLTKDGKVRSLEVFEHRLKWYESKLGIEPNVTEYEDVPLPADLRIDAITTDDGFCGGSHRIGVRVWSASFKELRECDQMPEMVLMVKESWHDLPIEKPQCIPPGMKVTRDYRSLHEKLAKGIFAVELAAGCEDPVIRAMGLKIATEELTALQEEMFVLFGTGKGKPLGVMQAPAMVNVKEFLPPGWTHSEPKSNEVVDLPQSDVTTNAGGEQHHAS